MSVFWSINYWFQSDSILWQDLGGHGLKSSPSNCLSWLTYILPGLKSGRGSPFRFWMMKEVMSSVSLIFWVTTMVLNPTQPPKSKQDWFETSFMDWAPFLSSIMRVAVQIIQMVLVAISVQNTFLRMICLLLILQIYILPICSRGLETGCKPVLFVCNFHYKAFLFTGKPRGRRSHYFSLQV